ncbi:MAG: tripartite tricarboxylate transporter substrate binding protein [Betaproteobacteria bacterium]|nr:tripartite tricarboxylate transporter substrate binding protein [Betaproteobacteria bacterium]
MEKTLNRAKYRLNALLGLLVAIPVAALAQAYPVKPVRVIVPLAAGGSTDNNGRLMAEKLGQALGQSFFVENRVGAATDIGIGTLARSAPDGYTIGVVPLGSVASGILLRKLPYDPFKDLAPIGGISKGALVIVVAASSPYQTLADLIAAAKAKPGAISFGSIGMGSSHHLAGELLKQMTGTDMLHVPYKGASESNVAVLAGQIESSISGSSSIASQVRAGKLRTLAVTNGERVPPLPDVPSVAEYVPGYSAGAGTLSLMAPGGTPTAIIMRLNTEMRAALKQPEVIKRLADAGEHPSPSTPEELAVELRGDIDKYTKLVKNSGVKLN